MDEYINDKLTSLERAELLRSAGFNINKDRGQINGIKNICYEDTQPDLCISLDTGKVNDFGDPYYSGDVVFLLKEALNCDFEGVKSYIKQETGREFGEEIGVSGKGNARSLYGDPRESRGRNEGTDNKEEKGNRPKTFWKKRKWKRMKKCQDELEENGIPGGHKYIKKYDGISLDKLIEMGCGFYSYKDFEFGLSNYNYNENDYFIFPYKTGAMLYRRNEDGKDVKHIKASKSKHSLFNVKKDDGENEIVFIMKSPREAMNFGMYATDYKVVGLNSGENVYGDEITDLQSEQVNQIVQNGGEVYVCLDCDDPDSYEFALLFCQKINELLNYKATVKLMNIHKKSGGEYKDITDVVQQAMDKGTWFSEPVPELPEHLFNTIHKSIKNSEVIQ